ncbi:MAG: DUF1501 domain-containing protein [Planctomycetales bacterium]|nr:DUF1501 domain-containing protein [Planctomycetales bacterium]MCA9135999.1 DUF1501 domain-containing protein [Planctomycetales bacterium]
MNRRRWLGTLGTGIGTAWLTPFAEQLSRAAESKRDRPKSLLMIWLQGGPSQLETFDPHPGTLIGGDVKGIATSIPGIQIADTLPAVAQQLEHVSLVRSLISKEGDHERATYHLKTGWRPEPTIVHPAIGSIVCHHTKDNLEIPRHISILPTQWPARAGYLGPSFDAFQIGDPADPIPNLTRRVSETQLQQRAGPLLGALEHEFQRGRIADLDQSRTLHRTATTNALRMMSSQQLDAFDIQQESHALQADFGDHAFGRGCLAAIRLLEAGVRCVEVELSGWDSHINNHEIQSIKTSILDRALASTLVELRRREMFDQTVVFCGGEFGRTPTINPAGGRDHWPHGFSALLAGGKLRRGYVHGSTAANPDLTLLKSQRERAIDPSRLAEKLVSVPDLHATLLHALDIDYTAELVTPIGRPLKWSDGTHVTQLLQG